MPLAHYQGYVENVSTGKALGAAVIRVYSYPGNILQSTFADLSSTPKATVLTDANGAFDFYIADGNYDIEYVFGGVVLTRLINVAVFNPTNYPTGANVDTILGATAVTGHFGTFTGATIADNVTAKTALQSLETATELRATSTALAATGGSSLVGFLQSGAGAQNDVLQTMLRRGVAVMPEQFYVASDGGNMAPAINRAFQTAANWGAVDKARYVLFSDWYVTTTPVEKVSYVPIIGVGPARCGLKPTISSGYALTDLNTPGYSMTEATMAEFGIDGVNMTGTAGGILIDNEQQVYFDRINIINVTTGDALRIINASYNVHLTRSAFRNNKRHMVIGTTNAGLSNFPTTVYIDGNIFEQGIASTGEALLFEDTMCISITRNIFQSNKQKTLYNVKRGAGTNPPRGDITFDNNYYEDNTNGQVDATLYNLDGNATNKLDGVTIGAGEKFYSSGAGPAGGVIRALNTKKLKVAVRRINTGENFLVDLGGNTNFDIDATNVGLCDLQSTKYTRSKVQIEVASGAVVKQAEDGRHTFVVTRSAPGDFIATMTPSFAGVTKVFPSVSCFGAGATTLVASAQPTSANACRLLFKTDAGVLTDPEKFFFEIEGFLAS